MERKESNRGSSAWPRRTASGAAATVALLLSGVATAQYATDFEDITGLPEGVELNGQDSYYNPDPPNSISALVYTYTDNALGVVRNPQGGDQFVAGTGPADNVVSRSQRDVDYGTPDVFTITYDFVVTFDNRGPSEQNVGSFSTQLFPGEATFIHVLRWNDPALPVRCNARYVAYSAGGVLFQSPYVDGIAGPEWEDLEVNHWYRASTTVDLSLNQIVHVSIVDLDSGDCATFEPTGWYLEGGAVGGLPRPGGFRFFAGTAATAGNTLGFDNVSIDNCAGDLDGNGDVGTTDLIEMLGDWGANPCGPPDLDGDGNVGTIDLIQLLGAWGPCPV